VLEQQDIQTVARIAADAANKGVQGHEAAMHAPEKFVPSAMVSPDPTPPAPPQPVGFLQASPQVNSSKRLESFIALGIAAAVAVLGFFFAKDHLTEVAAVAGAFLTYSLALQGVSAAAERNLP